MPSNLYEWLAVVGTLIGLAGLVSQIWQFVRSGYRVQVVTSFAWFDTGVELVGIEVRNLGRMAITVQSLSIEPGTTAVHIPIQGFMVGHGSPLPVRLDPHSSQSWYVGRAECRLAIAARPDAQSWVCARVTLATGKTVRSGRLVLDLDAVGPSGQPPGQPPG